MASPTVDDTSNTAKQNKDLTTALARYTACQPEFLQWSREANEDFKFLSGEQWDDQAKQTREQAGQVCLTSDRISPAIRQVKNDLVQNTPAIIVNPTGNGPEQDEAKNIQGLVRHIEYDSGATTVYAQAAFNQVSVGKGYIRVCSKYEAEDSMDQKLCIEEIANPANVIYGPHEKLDGSDAEYCFVINDIPKDDYARLYTTGKIADAVQNDGGGWNNVDLGPAWMSSDTIRVAEYWFKDYKSATLTRWKNKADGSYYDTTVPPEGENVPAGTKAKDWVKGPSRDVQMCKIKCYLINGMEVLKPYEFPGYYLPIVPVIGDVVYVDGKKLVSGMVKAMKDPQKAYNFMISVRAEIVAMAPKAPWVAAAEAIKNYDKMYASANTMNYSVLPYNHVDAKGNPIPPPQRQTAGGDVGAVSAVVDGAAGDLQATSGIYDGTVGAQSNETSGKAIMARGKQAETSNAHYYDHLCASIRHIGRIIVGAIPTYYDTARAVRIIKPDDQTEVLQINQMLDNGKKHDFTLGKYDVVIETGPSYATKREEAASAAMELAAGIGAQNPQLVANIIDLVAGAQDWPMAKQIAARLKASVPPEILAATGEADQNQMEPEEKVQALQQQLTQATQQLQQMQLQEQMLQVKLADETQKNQTQEQKNQIEKYKADLDYNIKAQELALEEATTELEFTTKQQSFQLQREQMEIQRQQMGIKALQAASDISDGMHDREDAYLDRSRDKTIATISDIKPIEMIPIGQETVPSNEEMGGKFNS